jgi:hypothetical protein
MSYITKIFNTPFFQNKFVLYGSLLLVLLSILRHLAARNINAVVLMALIGLLMSYFSKNMIIVLLTVFATVFILEMVGSQGVMEGMVSKNEKNDNENENDNDNGEGEGEGEGGSGTGDKKGVVKKGQKDKNNQNEAANEGVDDKSKPSVESKTEGNKTLNEKKTKQGMTKLSPASYDGKEDDSEGTDSMKEANRIDYASTLEQAYDNIENIIGEDGIRGLTDQTKSLMNQQKELMNNMKEMGPLLKSAEGFMHQITGKGGIQGITNMLKGFATPGAAKN